MSSRWTAALLVLSVLAALGSATAQDKLKFATVIKATPVYYLPPLAAEEKGFWRESGLEAEWVPFEGSSPFHRALAAGAINIGMETALPLLVSISRGSPTILVSDMEASAGFSLWVLAQSPIKEPRNLKGARVGVVTLGGAAHAYAILVVRSLGLERDIRFVGLGGIPPAIAALKAKAVGTVFLSPFSMAVLKEKGEVREVANLEPFLPKPWVAQVIVARRDFVKNQSPLVRRALAALIKSGNFINQNEDWAVQKIREQQGVSPGTAREMYKGLKYSPDGKTNPQALDNLRKFALEFGLLKREEMPLLEQLYTPEFTG